jgi:hypothetical protein
MNRRVYETVAHKRACAGPLGSQARPNSNVNSPRKAGTRAAICRITTSPALCRCSRSALPTPCRRGSGTSGKRCVASRTSGKGARSSSWSSANAKWRWDGSSRYYGAGLVHEGNQREGARIFLSAETQRGQAATEAKPGLTQRRRGTRRNAEKENSLRTSANLCASALNLRSVRANRDIAV